jgi:hypothetical protein
VSLPEPDQRRATSSRPTDEPLPRTYFDRPPLVGHADRFAPLDAAVLEVAPPPTRPAVVGTLERRVPTVTRTTHHKRVVAGGVALAVLLVLGLAARIWYARGTPEPPPPPADPAATIEAIAAKEPPGTQWDGAPLVVTFEVTPAAASIRFDGQPVPGTSVATRRDGRTHTVVVSAPGHVTQAQAFVPVQTGRLRVALRRVGAR